MSDIKERTQITGRETLLQLVTIMAEGNVGAATVLAHLLKGEGGGSMIDILHLDDMNIRGPQVWLAFKDYAGQDYTVFVEAIRKREPEMIKVVNNARGLGPEWIAMSGGASQYGNRRRTQ